MTFAFSRCYFFVSLCVWGRRSRSRPSGARQGRSRLTGTSGGQFTVDGFSDFFSLAYERLGSGYRDALGACPMTSWHTASRFLRA
jgi:hypothetical protein